MLSRMAWHCAVVLNYLARAGVPLTFNDMGATLNIDHTQLHLIMRRLEGIGAIEREPLPDTGTGRRRSSYRASRLVRMASR